MFNGHVGPDSDDNPPLLSKLGVGVRVTPCGRGDLGSPPCDVATRWPEVFRAAVPVAAVDEDRNVGSSKHDVGAAPNSGQRLEVHAVSETSAVEYTAER